MQFVPESADLLAAVAAVLDDVLPAVPAHQRHEVRVAANLTRIVEREIRLGDQPDPDLPEDDAERWAALVAITRRDLAIAKPGYDAWELG